MRALVALTIALTGLAPALGDAGELTTFSFESAGCSGGGNVCGSFPLIPTGAASYEHAAGSDGSIELAAAAERGLPADVCVPGRPCEHILRYHGEALGRVWADVGTVAGSAAQIDADYELEELTATAEAIIGTATAGVAGSLSIVPAPGSDELTCSDGSPIVGADSLAIDQATPLGAGTFSATIGCDGDGTLPAMTWRVLLLLTVDATSDGGMAQAAARGQLVKVTA